MNLQSKFKIKKNLKKNSKKEFIQENKFKK